MASRIRPPCKGCAAVWKDEPYYGHGCRFCFRSASHSCRCHLDDICKFPGTLIKSSPNPQYFAGITSPTVSSPTPVPASPMTLLNPDSTTGSVKDVQLAGKECSVSVTTDTSCDTPSDECEMPVFPLSHPLTLGERVEEPAGLILESPSAFLMRFAL